MKTFTEYLHFSFSLNLQTFRKRRSIIWRRGTTILFKRNLWLTNEKGTFWRFMLQMSPSYIVFVTISIRKWLFLCSGLQLYVEIIKRTFIQKYNSWWLVYFRTDYHCNKIVTWIQLWKQLFLSIYFLCTEIKRNYENCLNKYHIILCNFYSIKRFTALCSMSVIE